MTPTPEPASPVASGTPVPEIVESVEYELRYPDGTFDTFNDIGDAVDFQDNHFPISRLFRRAVTTHIYRSVWEQVQR